MINYDDINLSISLNSQEKSNLNNNNEYKIDNFPSTIDDSLNSYYDNFYL